MESKLARILKCRFSPVALTRTDSRPENALSFRPGRRACIMSLFVNAAKGRTCVADAAACGCPGAVTGMGFGDGYRNAENTNIIQLGAIDVKKTELKYKGEKPYGSGTQDGGGDAEEKSRVR